MNAAMENAGPGVPVWGRDSVGLGVSEGGRGLWSWEGGTPVWGGSIILGWWRTVLVSVISAYKRGHVITSSSKLSNYHIAGNFRGRKLSQFSRFCGYLRKFSPRNLGAWCPLARQKQAIRESFLCENHIFHQSVKLFSLESFPLDGTSS